MSASNGTLFVVAAPSGAGKTSLVNALVASTPSLEVAVSHTTRKQRPDEVDGENYFFISEPAFRRMIGNDEFAEHALVFGSHYGTSKQEIARILEHGHHIVLEIDWQGAQQIRAEFPDVASIFILPPSLASLRQRLEARAQDDEFTVRKRMETAIDEISHYDEFDYIVVNDDFDEALQAMMDIVHGRGEYLSLEHQQKALKTLIGSLLDPQNGS